MSLYQDELRMVMGGQVPAGVGGWVGAGGCQWSGVKTLPQEWLEREGRGRSSEPGFQNCVQELGVETQCREWQKELKIWDQGPCKQPY